MTAGRDPDQFTTTGWPWRAGNEFRLLDDGGDFFARMLQAIDAASRYVLLEMYLVRSGAVARAGRGCGPEQALREPPPGAPRAGGAAGRLALSEARQRSVRANGVLRRSDCAATRAWIMSAYFVPSRRFRKALRRAARRGVDVRLLVPGARTDHPWVRQAARRFYGRMLRNGVKIFEYQ